MFVIGILKLFSFHICSQQKIYNTNASSCRVGARSRSGEMGERFLQVNFCYPRKIPLDSGQMTSFKDLQKFVTNGTSQWKFVLSRMPAKVINLWAISHEGQFVKIENFRREKVIYLWDAP